MIENKTALYLDSGYSGSGLETKVEPIFSYLHRPAANTIPNRVMTIQEAYENIRSTCNQYQTDFLRSITDKTIARNYKARNFDQVCFSGVFTKRCDAGLIRHSGLLCIDFDHMSNLQELKATLLGDSFLESVLLFISPSGDGLKWVVEIDIAVYSHLQWFNALAAYLKATYQFEIDASGKDISRCCFLPYDPEVFINPQYIKH